MVKNEVFPVHDFFMDAWNDMFLWVEEHIKSGFSYQILETAIWIEVKTVTEKSETTYPIYFYDARDRSINEGWSYNKN
jgi:hypothetical protein